MKKLMMMAMMLVASATTFAADSDALKAILKAKDYAEAQSLINSSLAQLASDAEKAKAYNKLVDLACEKFNKEENTKITNAAMQKNEPVDVEGMVAAGKVALQAAMDCDKYDQMPNEKGKVAPKFREKNVARTQSMRLSLLQETEKLVNDKKRKEALEIFDLYISTAKSPFFAGVKSVEEDPNMGYAAFYGGQSALLLEDFAKAKELFKVGVRDTSKQISEYSLDGMLQAMRNNVKSAADSAKYINELTELNKEFADKEKIFAFLSEAYMATGENAKVMALADERLAQYPGSTLPYVYKGIIYQNDRKFDEAIAEYNKVKEENSPVFLNCIYNKAVCKWNKAAAWNEEKTDVRTGRMKPADEATFKELMNSAQADFEKAKELDPDQLTVKWKYLLHNIYTQTGQTDKAAALE